MVQLMHLFSPCKLESEVPVHSVVFNVAIYAFFQSFAGSNVVVKIVKRSVWGILRVEYEYAMCHPIVSIHF